MTLDTPLERERRYIRRQRWGIFLLLLFCLGTFVFWRICLQPADTYADIDEHFRYGSIGSDNDERGIPLRLFHVLPQMFPEHLPQGGNSYDAFGMIVEPGRERPVGFSKRRVLGIDLVGLNCAICHTGSLRASPESVPQVIVGMPSNTVDLQGFFLFLFRCANDPRFTVESMLEAIQKRGPLDAYESVAYPRAIRTFQEKLRIQQGKIAYWKDIPAFGPGRVDTFNPYKRLFFTDLPLGEHVGTADFPSLWLQRPREGMSLHWDGNNPSVRERNISAAIGAGVVAPNGTRAVQSSLDEPSMARLADWILDLKPPAFPAHRIDPTKLAHGRAIYNQHCASCHAFDGARVGHVTPWDDPELRTDPHRLRSFTKEMAERMNTWGEGYPWRFTHFRKTDGYANAPLDGVWLRGPYLHNGSVPTLRALLYPEERPAVFYRGNDVYDWPNVGFDSTTPAARGRAFFRYDTTLPGNSNAGHTYGSRLTNDEKASLLEYLKTL